MNSGQTQVAFVNFEYLQKNSPIYSNLDTADINWVIPISQDMHIKRILGSALYTKLMDDIIANGTVTGLYANLLDNFICPALIYFIALDAADFNSIKWTNKGLLKKTSDTSDVPTQQDVTGYKNKLEKFAEFYANKMVEYLEANITSFPEYQNPGTSCDTVIPVTNAFTSTFFIPNNQRNTGNFDYFNNITNY